MRLSLFRYIANLKIASAQIACRDGLLIECIANQKFVNYRKTRYLILAIKTRPAVIPFEFLFTIHGEMQCSSTHAILQAKWAQTLLSVTDV